MAIFELADRTLKPLTETRFSTAGVLERRDLQRALRDNIGVIAPETLVLAEEFGEWTESRRRIDLLCLDKAANPVVVELKRDEDGGHMELQAVRYAAMVSTLTFRDAVDLYRAQLGPEASGEAAEAALLEFLGWDEPNEDAFAQDVRVVLASAEFGKELTTAVLWLNERGVDIRCVRLKPYRYGDRVFVDVQQVIPLPEAQEYQVKVKQKERVEREARESSRDYTRFDVTLSGRILERLPKRRAIFEIVRWVCANGATPQDVERCVPWRPQGLFFKLDGARSAEEMESAMDRASAGEGGSRFESRRHYFAQDELIVSNGATYAFTNQWSGRTREEMAAILAAFPESGASVRESGAA